MHRWEVSIATAQAGTTPVAASNRYRHTLEPDPEKKTYSARYVPTRTDKPWKNKTNAQKFAQNDVEWSHNDSPR